VSTAPIPGAPVAAYGVKKYVAVVRSPVTGVRFRVFTTGDDRYYLFDALDPRGCSWGLQFPVLKKSLRRDIARALRHGWGNSL
jgi:hypothetical protein